VGDEGHGCGNDCRCECQVRGYVQPRLLLLLARKPAHGYELMDALRSVPGDENLSEPGLLYRTLRQFEADELVTSSWQTGVPGPARRVYQLTDSGREYLDLWARSVRATRERLGQFLTDYESLATRPQPPSPPKGRRRA
jgi:PadR family transcriptional regulator, regulatory protein PadR